MAVPSGEFSDRRRNRIVAQFYWFGVRNPPGETASQPGPATEAIPVQQAEPEPAPSPFANNKVEEKDAEDLQFMVVKGRAQRALKSRDRKTVQTSLQLLRGLRSIEARQLREQLTRHLANLPAE